MRLLVPENDGVGGDGSGVMHAAPLRSVPPCFAYGFGCFFFIFGFFSFLLLFGVCCLLISFSVCCFYFVFCCLNDSKSFDKSMKIYDNV